MAHSRPTVAEHPVDRLVGTSPGIAALRAQIQHLARFDTLGSAAVPTVLLQGETGTGKGLVARVMHDSGPRATGPFIAVNCAAIPETMLEAELFGFEPGAFTDAKRAKAGLFEAASGGTLLLDEIDALPFVLQGKLLTAIETKRVRRLGAVAERAVDVKLIVATNAVLTAAMAAGRFRADLYHRLAVVVLALPPLRERGADILALAQALLQHYATVHGVAPKQLQDTAQAWLQHYAWPGNVRELSHMMERVVLLHVGVEVDATTLQQLCLPPTPAALPAEPPAAVEAQRLDMPIVQAPQPPPELPDEAAQIRHALAQTRGNVVQAARLLGVSRDTLRYRMQRSRIARPRHTVMPTPVMGQSPGASASQSPPADRDASPQEVAHAAAGSAPPLPASPHPEHPEDETAALPHAVEPAGATRQEVVPPATVWEQKPVAVLALELTWPEVPGRELRRYEPWTEAARWEQAIMEKVRGFGGVPVQHAVSPLTWVFGLPHALEQLPLRAVHGALAIRQMVAEAGSPDLGPCPDVRLAVHFGGILVDSQARPLTAHVLAVGETLAFPVRLLGHAVPGEILVSPQVGRLVAGSVALEPRKVRLRAKHVERVGGYAVVGVNPGRARRHRGAGDTRGVFVGREHEVALLEAVVEQVTAGRGQVVGLVGPPGMGKSRLLAAVRQRLATQQIPYVEGRCLAYGRATPYLPVLDLLRDYCGITEDDRPLTLTEKVRLKLQQAGLDTEDSLPALLHLLGVPVSSAPFAALSAAMRKAQTFEILRHLFLKGGQQTPLALAVENLQWVDPTSEAFLTSLVASLAGVPLLFLGTYYPGYRPPWLDRSYVTQIVLQPLGHEASRAVISGVVHSTPLAPEIEQHMLTQAEGNPFFLEEFAHTVVEQSAQQPSLVIPETIHAVLAARIDHLSPEEKSLVQAAAVIGKDFSQPVLQAITALPEETLRQSLSQLQAAELLAVRSFAPAATYTFKHLLIQEAAYQSLPTSLRQQYHHQVAQVLVAQSPTLAETQPERIAHHYTEAGAPALAIPYWQHASRRAVERSAHAEALSHLTNGLALIKTLPVTAESTQQELDLQVTLGSALAVTKGYTTPEVGHAYARAHELCGHVADAAQRFPVLLGLWRFYAGRAEFQPARELEEELLTLAQQLHDPTGLTWAHFALGATLLRQGELARARIHLEQGIAAYDPQHYAASTFRYEQNPDAACRVAAAAVLWLLGYPDQALQRIQQALPLAQGPADRFTLANTRFYAAWVYYGLRQVDTVLAQTEAAMTVARAQGFTLFLELSTILHGWALATQGQRDEGIAHMQHSVATYRAADAVMHQPWYLGLFAEVYAQGGQIAAGLDAVTEALATAETTGERYWEAELYRRKGELLLLQAEAGAQIGVAEVCFQQALDIARRQQARSLELRAAMSLSRLWQRQGKWAAAQHLLAAVYGWFTEGFDTVDLQEAKVLLDALSHR